MVCTSTTSRTVVVVVCTEAQDWLIVSRVILPVSYNVKLSLILVSEHDVGSFNTTCIEEVNLLVNSFRVTAKQAITVGGARDGESIKR
jgi:hypothetical protein